MSETIKAGDLLESGGLVGRAIPASNADSPHTQVSRVHPMTPSKEALSAANRLSEAGLLFHEHFSESNVATLIDTAFAEHRERVRRLVAIAQRAVARGINREYLGHDSDGTALERACAIADEIEAELVAALAPLLEQETVTP